MPLRRLIRLVDRRLRRRLGIREFCDDPECLFRIRIASAEPWLTALGAPVAPGERVLELHFWNERMPHLPAHGPDVAWAARGTRMLRKSLCLLAEHLCAAPDLEPIAAVVGVGALFSSGERPARQRLLARLGFVASAPRRAGLGRFREFWENVHASLLIWAFNGRSLRGRNLRSLRRVALWMSKEELLRRYGPPAAAASTDGHTVTPQRARGRA